MRRFPAGESRLRGVLFLLPLVMVLLQCVHSDGASPGSSGRKPNIIWIMADDLGYADLGAYGQKQIKTPRLDKMAKEGMVFSQVYSGSTVCAPSRSCLMTGQHTGHTWVRGNSGRSGRVPLRPQDVTVADALRKAGYVCGITGKWGLGEPGTTGVPNRKGFHEWLGYLNQARAHDYYQPYIWHNEKQFPLKGNEGGQKKDYVHDYFTQFALSFIKKHKGDPFFLYLAYTIPHAKMQIPSTDPYSSAPWPENEKKFAAMVTLMDRDVGQILDLLKKLKIDDDTVVFFTSDNGAHREGGHDSNFFKSSGPLRGIKRDLYEGGIRVPMIVRWPGRIKANSKSDHVWAFWDFLPTACDLAEIKPPREIDGMSVLPALLGEKAEQHSYLYWEFHEGGFGQAVRQGSLKAVRPKKGKAIELYDLSKDIGEKHNLASQFPQLVAQMDRIMQQARTESPEWPQK